MREIVDRVTAAAGLEREDVDRVVKAAFGEIVERLARGGSVRIQGFGTFPVASSRDGAGRDFGKRPAMRGLVRRTVRFRAGAPVARAVKEGLR